VDPRIHPNRALERPTPTRRPDYMFWNLLGLPAQHLRVAKPHGLSGDRTGSLSAAPLVDPDHIAVAPYRPSKSCPVHRILDTPHPHSSAIPKPSSNWRSLPTSKVRLSGLKCATSCTLLSVSLHATATCCSVCPSTEYRVAMRCVSQRRVRRRGAPSRTPQPPSFDRLGGFVFAGLQCLTLCPSKRQWRIRCP
jgi:hypothetical protein